MEIGTEQYAGYGGYALDTRTYELKHQIEAKFVFTVQFDLLYHLMSSSRRDISLPLGCWMKYGIIQLMRQPDLVRVHVKNSARAD
jgi:hypothetical protein